MIKPIPKKQTGPRWWMLLAMAGLTLLVASRFADAKQLISVLRQGSITWIFVGLLLHLLYFIFYAGLYRVGFRTVDLESRLWDLVPLVFISVLINAVVPTGGAGGAAVFVNDATKRGQSGIRAAVGVIWVFIADLISLVPFLLYACVYLYEHQALRFYDVFGAGIFLFFVGCVCPLLAVAGRHVKIVQSVLTLVQRTANHLASWLKRPDWMSQDWPRQTASRLADSVNTVLASPQWMVYTLVLGFVMHIVNLAGLYALFLAFQQPVDFGSLVSGFGMGFVFYIISIIPQGVGAVEGIMTLVFYTLGIPKANALAITLTFRGLNFWLPILIGLLSMRSLSRVGRQAGTRESYDSSR